MKKWNVAAVRAAKGAELLGCCTAYDACFARLADEDDWNARHVGEAGKACVIGRAATELLGSLRGPDRSYVPFLHLQAFRPFALRKL